MKRTVVMAFGLMFVNTAMSECAPGAYPMSEFKKRYSLAATTFEDAEEANIAETVVDGITQRVPFGSIHREWESLKSKARTGDTLFFASTIQGETAYLLVRKGCVISSLMTRVV